MIRFRVLLQKLQADASTLGFASDYLSNMSINLESAHGRIMDVDLAEESANLAKYSMQYEAAATAVAQANVAMGAVLDLLLGSINQRLIAVKFKNHCCFSVSAFFLRGRMRRQVLRHISQNSYYE